MKEIVYVNQADKAEQNIIIQKINKIYNERKSSDSELSITGSWYEKELHMMDALVQSQEDVVPDYYQEGFFIDDELLKARYLLVIAATVVSRFAIAHGLPESEAFGISDAYIEQSAKTKSIREINLMAATISVDYANRIKAHERKSENRYVRACKNYISENICENITIENLSAECGISSEYLCRLFKKNTGQTLHSFIKEQKLERAAYLIKHSSQNIKEIAWQLGYSNCGYFSHQFKLQYFCSPMEYRLQ